LRRIRALDGDDAVDGILVQVPLPPHISKAAVLGAVSPAKDVDAFHPESVGHALIGDETMAPCTPQGVLLLLDEAGVQLAGAEVCIINHSNLIGKPLAALLINRDATVTVCHKKTRDLAAHTRRADVVVTATGVPGLLTAKHLRPGAVVVDVGITRGADGKVHGDADASVWTWPRGHARAGRRRTDDDRGSSAEHGPGVQAPNGTSGPIGGAGEALGREGVVGDLLP